jgi:hypothetical protein
MTKRKKAAERKKRVVHRKAEADRKLDQIRVLLSENDKREIEAAAARVGMAPSPWLRYLALREARKESDR